MKTSMTCLMVLLAMGGCSSGGDDGGGSSATGCAKLCTHTTNTQTAVRRMFADLSGGNL